MFSLINKNNDDLADILSINSAAILGAFEHTKRYHFPNDEDKCSPVLGSDIIENILNIFNKTNSNQEPLRKEIDFIISDILTSSEYRDRDFYDVLKEWIYKGNLIMKQYFVKLLRVYSYAGGMTNSYISKAVVDSIQRTGNIFNDIICMEIKHQGCIQEGNKSKLRDITDALDEQDDSLFIHGLTLDGISAIVKHYISDVKLRMSKKLSVRDFIFGEDKTTSISIFMHRHGLSRETPNELLNVHTLAGAFYVIFSRVKQLEELENMIPMRPEHGSDMSAIISYIPTIMSHPIATSFVEYLSSDNVSALDIKLYALHWHAILYKKYILDNNQNDTDTIRSILTHAYDLSGYSLYRCVLNHKHCRPTAMRYGGTVSMFGTLNQMLEAIYTCGKNNNEFFLSEFDSIPSSYEDMVATLYLDNKENIPDIPRIAKVFSDMLVYIDKLNKE